MDSKETSSRVAIITGATGALGTAVAKRFLEAGGRVAIPVRPTNHLPEIPPAFSHGSRQYPSQQPILPWRLQFVNLWRRRSTALAGSMYL